MKLLDIGCGTGHILNELAKTEKTRAFVGLDISRPMLTIAARNNVGVPNVVFVEGDGLQLPFPRGSFDVVITRLAEFSVHEAYRVLRTNGHFFKYGLGPDADKEVEEFFPDRLEKESFFFPKDMSMWKQEVCEYVKDAGFTVDSIEEYRNREYHDNEESLMDVIEMVPLVKDFDREKDSVIIKKLADKYREGNGFSTSWHYYVLEARRYENDTSI
jgi:SAM-dependent methyltransferase